MSTNQPFQQQPAPQVPYTPPRKSHTGRAVAIVVGSILAAIILTFVGCTAIIGGALDSATDSPTGEVSPVVEGESPYDPTTAPSSVPTTEPPATTEPEEPAKDTTTIGKTLTYESGLAVRVVSVKVFNPGYAAGLVTGQKAVKVTWTVTNGTSANVDLSGAEARLTYGADGVQAESVYAEGVDGAYPFDGSLRPKQKKTATSAFSVPKAGLASVVVEVEPDFNSETAFFTGKVASK
jgi:hypothetical protein